MQYIYIIIAIIFFLANVLKIFLYVISSSNIIIISQIKLIFFPNLYYSLMHVLCTQHHNIKIQVTALLYTKFSTV